MTALPSLRSPDPDRRVDPQFDYRTDLGRREDRLDRLSAALEQESRLLREERQRLEGRERALERRELASEIAAAEPPADAALLFSLRDLPTDPKARTKFLADLVILAGKRRRSEIPDDPPLPPHPLARAVVLAGMRRRGEIAAGSKLASDFERCMAAISRMSRGEL